MFTGLCSGVTVDMDTLLKFPIYLGAVFAANFVWMGLCIHCQDMQVAMRQPWYQWPFRAPLRGIWFQVGVVVVPIVAVWVSI